MPINLNQFATLNVCLLAAALSACGGSSSKSSTPTDDNNNNDVPTQAEFKTSLFDDSSATVTNQYFPLEPGQSYIYEGINEDGETERVEATVSHLTETVNGIESAILLVREYEIDDGEREMTEETFDFFAQDTSGNVWYMGEDVYNFDDGEFSDQNGSWASGADVAQIGMIAVAGIQMKSELALGDTYIQEHYPGEAEDTASIENLAIGVNLANGTNHNALQIREWNPLEPEEMDEFKYYASGIGLIVEENQDGSERIELIDSSNQKSPEISATDFDNPRVVDNPYFPLSEGDLKEYEVYEEGELIETITIEILNLNDDGGNKVVNGIPVMVQRDRVRDADGLIIEDTYDWFAQDNAGNVWYVGEDVTNYEYDEEGNLLETNDGGSFEWGIDGAQPGIQMLAEPRKGDSYRQEYYLGEAEDIGAVIALEQPLTVSGTDYTVLVTEDWDPLDTEDPREHKYYAPGVGVVREEKVDDSEYVILVNSKL